MAGWASSSHLRLLLLSASAGQAALPVCVCWEYLEYGMVASFLVLHLRHRLVAWC